MTEAFASTAAQVLPVLAFAAVVELRGLGGRWPSAGESQGDDLFAARMAWLVASALTSGFAIYAVVAEMKCLDVLSGSPAAPGEAEFVRTVIIAGFVILIVLPAIAPVALARNPIERFMEATHGKLHLMRQAVRAGRSKPKRREPTE